MLPGIRSGSSNMPRFFFPAPLQFGVANPAFVLHESYIDLAYAGLYILKAVFTRGRGTLVA